MTDIPSPSTGDCDSFYSERDHRTNLVQPQPARPVAVVVAMEEAWADTPLGQLTLHWTASLIARMGRRFNHLRLWLAPDVAKAPCLLGHLGAATLGDAILEHLGAVDPCGRYTVVERVPTDAYVLTVGQDPAARADAVVAPRGWAAERASRGGGAHPQQGELNPIGAALAAALGSAAVYAHFNRRPLASAGYRRSGPALLSAWEGGAGSAVSPDAGARLGPDVNLGRCLAVGAGGLGGNALAILARVPGIRGVMDIAEPDLVELSNLNRLVEATVADRGSPKLHLVERALAPTTLQGTSHVASYQQLRSNGVISQADLDAYDLVMVGVDQLATRAAVQSDWPRSIVDAGTRGYTWRVSRHPASDGGCLGCLAGQSQNSYGHLYAPLDCAGGLPGQAKVAPVRPMDSYAFVAFFGAAFLAALTLRQAVDGLISASKIEADALDPAMLRYSSMPLADRCLCRCASPAVRAYRLGKFSLANPLESYAS
jgi:hypothetical protein